MNMLLHPPHETAHESQTFSWSPTVCIPLPLRRREPQTVHRVVQVVQYALYSPGLLARFSSVTGTLQSEQRSTAIVVVNSKLM
jgi:hypothetical protein